MGSSLKLGRISGIPVSVHPSWLIAVVFIAWTFASILERAFSSWSPTQYWTGAIIGAFLLFASVLAHELAHSLVAQRLKLPVDGITLFIFGGVSQIRGKYKSARDEFLVAFAGPLSSLVIGGLAPAPGVELPYAVESGLASAAKGGSTPGSARRTWRCS